MFLWFMFCFVGFSMVICLVEKSYPYKTKCSRYLCDTARFENTEVSSTNSVIGLIPT
ncbi:hypothetical protein KM92CIT3_90011 [uncultured Citrobacter sp.]|uniref:Uncharacterized protein n=1 Tax=uncultured Citrobacter sp. TaxID=200446 RepID=A0A212IR47_9ENTR|nr:hypothetical protein KL86CIT2_430003 [uncultured Citrobacter sp.]SBV69278.1 hypothetical protein KM92CIT3_90011 [uncultured Citrobacter sp.]